jgi:hypothetical protein
MTINNNNIFGAFTLGEVRSGRLTGEWLNKESVANYGWFGGGINTGIIQTSTVERIDFSNDSIAANPRSPLSATRYRLAATGNSNYGWFGGGSPGPVSTVERIDFSNDSATPLPRGPLSFGRILLSATGNSNYGWFGGGQIGGPIALSTVDRIDFSNDSVTASPRGPLSAARAYLAATGNSNYGWFGGGSVTSIVSRIDFANDSTTAVERGPLSLARRNLSATGNSNYGWFGGGDTGNNFSRNNVDRIDFANDSSTASVRGPLSSSKGSAGATANSNYGWFGGNSSPGLPAPLYFSTIERIDFSNDSATASPRSTFSTGRTSISATSGVLNIRRQKAGNYGWFGGGLISAVVDRIDFSNDSSTASPRGPLSLARNQLTATGNSNYGWFGGGTTNSSAPGATSTVNRIDFSNDSGTTPVRGLLSSARRTVSATGNSNYGWFGGGLNPASPASVTTVDRIDFSNDSSTASPRGPLTLARTGPAATGNSNYGWFGGGQTPTFTAFSTVDRIDFSNDGVTASPRGPLSSNRTGVVATGNSNYGWFGGGSGSFPSPSVATVDRIDFSNDSSTASPRGPLSLARNSSAATGNSNYGWFGGGVIPTPATFSTVDRIDFANDSSTASPRGPLSLARDSFAAASNTPIG